MSAYGVALFVHILGVVTFFSALALAQTTGKLLRGAATVEQVRSLMGVLQPTRRMFPWSAALLLASGLYMTAQVWTFTTSWVVVGIVTLVALIGVGTTLVGQRFAQVGMMAGTSEGGPVPDQLRTLIAEPTKWIVLSGNSAAAVGLVWLMTNKPGWVASISIVVVLWIAGALGGRASTARNIAV